MVRALALASLLASCGPTIEAAPQPLPPGDVYRASGDPFRTGPLQTTVKRLVPGESGAPFETKVHAPTVAGTYPVVVFQHGFLADIDWYDEILDHLASHGFVVVAPQMYAADFNPLTKGPASEEAIDAKGVTAWARRSAGAVMGVATDPRAPGLSGHSRGGKVIWLEVLQEKVEARALVGVDPVDGRGGPLGGQLEALPGPTEGLPPALVLGAGLGPVPAGSFGACAPAEDGFRHFFTNTTAPAWLFLAPGVGHADMLDEETWSADGICTWGTERAKMRVLTGGLLALQFRAFLQDDAGSRARLDAPGDLPLAPSFESK